MAGSQPRRQASFRNRPQLRLTQDLRFFPFLAQRPGVSNHGGTQRPLAQRGLSSPRLQSLLGQARRLRHYLNAQSVFVHPGPLIRLNQ